MFEMHRVVCEILYYINEIDRKVFEINIAVEYLVRVVEYLFTYI